MIENIKLHAGVANCAASLVGLCNGGKLLSLLSRELVVHSVVRRR